MAVWKDISFSKDGFRSSFEDINRTTGIPHYRELFIICHSLGLESELLHALGFPNEGQWSGYTHSNTNYIWNRQSSKVFSCECPQSFCYLCKVLVYNMVLMLLKSAFWEFTSQSSFSLFVSTNSYKPKFSLSVHQLMLPKQVRSFSSNTGTMK